jgi:hypothetical protein
MRNQVALPLFPGLIPVCRQPIKNIPRAPCVGAISSLRATDIDRITAKKIPRSSAPGRYPAGVRSAIICGVKSPLAGRGDVRQTSVCRSRMAERCVTTN